VNERRGLERLPRALSRQSLRGQPSQLVVDQWQQVAGCLFFAPAESVQDLGDFDANGLDGRRPFLSS